MNVKMVIVKWVCVFVILVGGVVFVSFVDLGEWENKIFCSLLWM